MTATAILEKTTTGKRQNGGPALISTEAFYRKYSQREDGYKYELVNGHVEKFKKTMNDSQANIVENLNFFFYSLKVLGKIQGSFQTEKDNELWKDHVRIPDMCYLNQQQLVDAYEGKHPVAEFVIEVVSPTDRAFKYSEKIEDYFKAGVKVVWMIYPNTKQVQVHLHDSPNVTNCKGDLVCSAAPVLPEFALSVNDIFKKPSLV